MEAIDEKTKELRSESQTMRASADEQHSTVMARISELEQGQRDPTDMLGLSDFCALEKKMEDKLVNLARAQVFTGSVSAS